MTGRPRGTGGKAKELTPDQIRRIDKCLTGTRHELRNRALFYLGLGSGMRISEIIGLQVGDIATRGSDHRKSDNDGAAPATAKLARSWWRVRGRIVLEKHSTKSKRSRTVAVSKQAVKHVQAYLDSLETRPGPSAPLFPSQTRPRRPMTDTNAITTLKRMFTAAGVEHASSHSLRRTHANTLRRHGVDLKVIQEQLGHSSLAVTERYFEVDPLEQQRAIDQLRF